MQPQMQLLQQLLQIQLLLQMGLLLEADGRDSYSAPADAAPAAAAADSVLSEAEGEAGCRSCFRWQMKLLQLLLQI